MPRPQIHDDLKTAPACGPVGSRRLQRFAKAAPAPQFQSLSISNSNAAPDGARREGVRLEVLFAPLAGSRDEADRFLGLYQPLAGAFTSPLDPLVIVDLAGAPIEVARNPLRLAAVDGRRIA